MPKEVCTLVPRRWLLSPSIAMISPMDYVRLSRMKWYETNTWQVETIVFVGSTQYTRYVSKFQKSIGGVWSLEFGSDAIVLYHVAPVHQMGVVIMCLRSNVLTSSICNEIGEDDLDYQSHFDKLDAGQDHLHSRFQVRLVGFSFIADLRSLQGRPQQDWA